MTIIHHPSTDSIRQGLRTLLDYALAHQQTCAQWIGALAILLAREGVRHG